MNGKISFGETSEDISMSINLPTLILVSKETIENNIIRYESRIKENYQLQASVALGLSILSVLISVENFRNLFGIPSETWQALYLFFFIASLLFFAFSLCKWVTNRKERTIEFVLSQICKEGSVQTVSAVLENSSNSKGRFKLEEAPDWLVTPSPWTPEK